MDHIANKLGQAGYDVGGLYTQPTTVKPHAEKITHIVSSLNKAGMTSDGSTVSTTKTTSDHSNTKWIIIGAVLGTVLIVALGLVASFVIRRSRQRKSYGKVNKKQAAMEEKDVFNADLDESQALHESPEQVQSSRLQSSNYESGYDNVDTGYDGSAYDLKPSHGDKRAQYGAR